MTRFEKIKNNKLVVNSGIFFVGSFAVNLGNYIFHFLMARMLDVQVYGELQSLIALTAIFSIPSGALLTLIVKYVANFKAEENINKIYTLFIKSVKLFGLIALVLISIIIIASPHLADFLQINSSVPILILSLSVLLAFFNSINHGVLQGLQKFKSITLINLLTVASKVILAVILVKLSLRVNGVLGAIVLSGIIGYLITFMPLKFLFKKTQTTDINTKEIFKYIWPVFWTVLFTTLLYNLDVVLVKHFFSPEIAGQYSALALIGHIIIFIAGPMATVMFPMVAHAHTRGEKHYAIFKQTIGLTLGMGLLGVLGYFILPNLIIKILVGNKFLNMAPYLGWFAISMLLYSLINTLSRYLLSIYSVKYIYVLLVGILCQVAGIFIWHENLWQIVWVMNASMAIILINLLIIYSRGKIKRVKELLVYNDL
ncbi:MAG: oligosaccharide flippase family protein [Patescibacteria group bacterium]|nr:oligosaccharide flippase family protein [Patescibacteria group bacterium]